MKQFTTIQKLDTGILYCLELASSISILLLAFGLIASMANVLTKGAILTDSIIMQRIWAVTQSAGIDASVAGTIVRTFQYHQQGERVKMWVYALLSCLLLFTAAIVLNIESVQQTLNLTLAAAYVHVFIPVELLIWIRSLAIVLLIVAHALRHVQIGNAQESQPTQRQPEQPIRVEMTPDLIEALRQALKEVRVVEESPVVTKQIAAPAEETNPLESVLQELDALLPSVSREDITAVVMAYSFVFSVYREV